MAKGGAGSHKSEHCILSPKKKILGIHSVAFLRQGPPPQRAVTAYSSYAALWHAPPATAFVVDGDFLCQSCVMDLLEDLDHLQLLSLKSKVCTELENHLGEGDADMAEFIIDLAEGKTLRAFWDAILTEVWRGSEEGGGTSLTASRSNGGPRH